MLRMLHASSSCVWLNSTADHSLPTSAARAQTTTDVGGAEQPSDGGVGGRVPTSQTPFLCSRCNRITCDRSSMYDHLHSHLEQVKVNMCLLAVLLRLDQRELW
jgi:hypothetical protein